VTETEKRPDIQLIANVVELDGNGSVLLAKYDPDGEKWWLPGGDMEPYEHPEERVAKILDGLGTLSLQDLQLAFVESFRGRRGWHIMFNYVAVGAETINLAADVQWFSIEALPKTKHGGWELEVIKRAIIKAEFLANK
jgi:ADP-ribose pyrophosphatase YjhB (NUDIX family)